MPHIERSAEELLKMRREDVALEEAVNRDCLTVNGREEIKAALGKRRAQQRALRREAEECMAEIMLTED